MAVIEIAKIQVRRGQENQTGIPTLAGGEFAWAADTEHLYIGLRREDGGSRDANVRILTENDLFGALGTTSTAYIYRQDTGITSPTGSVLTEVERSVQQVLDEGYVSVKHFGSIGDGNNEDSYYLQLAVNRLFLNDLGLPGNPARKLIIPAGTYDLTATVYIPANTTIVGEGIDKTIINVCSTLTHAFQTISTDGWTFDNTTTFIDSNMKPSGIFLSNMTIKYDEVLTTVTDAKTLLSLDVAPDAVIKNVKFVGSKQPGITATETYSAIDIRGYDQVTSENIRIDNCRFEGVQNGILSNYDTTKVTVENGYFYKLGRGVNLNNPRDPAATAGPRHYRIINNKFERIDLEGIFAGDTQSDIPTYHQSKNNQFIDVGNFDLGEGNTTTSTSVINFVSEGNSSVDDYFLRFDEYQDTIGNTATTFVYKPTVDGRAVIDNSYVNTVTLVSSATTTVCRFPITGYSQNLTIKYNIYQTGVLSTGTYSNALVSAWNTATTYYPGDLARYVFTVYSALSTSTNLQPDLYPTDWEFSGFSYDPYSAIDRLGTLEIYLPKSAERADAADRLWVTDQFNYSGDDGINYAIIWDVTVDPTYNYYDVTVYQGSAYDIVLEYKTTLTT